MLTSFQDFGGIFRLLPVRWPPVACGWEFSVKIVVFICLFRLLPGGGIDCTHLGKLQFHHLYFFNQFILSSE